MLHFFDYVYYKSCQFYDKHGEGSGAGISGLAFLSLIQFLNLLSVVTVFWLIFPYEFILTTGDKILGAFVYIVIIFINGIRYNKLNYDILKERWDNEDKKNQRKKQIGVISYILITIVSVNVLMLRKSVF
jgi:hypothetical protein